MELLNGKVSKEILNKISFEIARLQKKKEKVPRLDVILVGNDFGSVKYVGMKEKVGKGRNACSSTSFG